jgi:hypothetical protein
MTPEKVFSAGAPADRPQGGSRFMVDPTTGALIVSPELDLKIRKAILREVRRMKLRLYYSLACLYLHKFALESQSALLRVERYLGSYFSDLRRSGHE